MTGYLQRLAQRANGQTPIAAHPERSLRAQRQAEHPAPGYSEPEDASSTNLGEEHYATPPARPRSPAGEDSGDTRPRAPRTPETEATSLESPARRPGPSATELPQDGPALDLATPSGKSAQSTPMARAPVVEEPAGKPPLVKAPTRLSVQAKREPGDTADRQLGAVNAESPPARPEPVSAWTPPSEERRPSRAPPPTNAESDRTRTDRMTPLEVPTHIERQAPLSMEAGPRPANKEHRLAPIVESLPPDSPSPQLERVIEQTVERKTQDLLHTLELSRPRTPRLEPPHAHPPPKPRREEQPREILRTERVEVVRPAPEPPKIPPAREVRSGRSNSRSRSKLRFGLGQM